jgi:hypothetical protein
VSATRTHPFGAQEAGDITRVLKNGPVQRRVPAATASKFVRQRAEAHMHSGNVMRKWPRLVQQRLRLATTRTHAHIIHTPNSLQQGAMNTPLQQCAAPVLNSLCILRVRRMPRHLPQPILRPVQVVVFCGIEQAAMRLCSVRLLHSLDVRTSHVSYTRTRAITHSRSPRGCAAGLQGGCGPQAAPRPGQCAHCVPVV